QVVVEPSPDRMHVRIVETGDYGSSSSVNYTRLRTTQAQNLFILTPGDDFSGRDGDGFDKRGHAVRGDLGVVHYEVSRHGRLRFRSFPIVICEGGGSPPFGLYLWAAAAAGTTYSENFVAGRP